MGVHGQVVHFLSRIGQADGGDAGDAVHGAQGLQRAVVIAAALAEPSARGVERQKRHNNEGRRDVARQVQRRRASGLIQLQRVAGAPAAKHQWGVATDHDRHCQLQPVNHQGAGQGGRVHLRPLRAVEGGGEGALTRVLREVARGGEQRIQHGACVLHQTLGGIGVGVGRLFAAAAHGGAKIGFDGHDPSLSAFSGRKVGGAARASRAWITRWAPYAQAHEPGQGQLPSSELRPRGYVAFDVSHSMTRHRAR